jgi:hypothetical protein
LLDDDGPCPDLSIANDVADPDFHQVATAQITIFVDGRSLALDAAGIPGPIAGIILLGSIIPKTGIDRLAA